MKFIVFSDQEMVSGHGWQRLMRRRPCGAVLAGACGGSPLRRGTAHRPRHPPARQLRLVDGVVVDNADAHLSPPRDLVSKLSVDFRETQRPRIPWCGFRGLEAADQVKEDSGDRWTPGVAVTRDHAGAAGDRGGGLHTEIGRLHPCGNEGGRDESGPHRGPELSGVHLHVAPPFLMPGAHGAERVDERHGTPGLFWGANDLLASSEKTSYRPVTTPEERVL